MKELLLKKRTLKKGDTVVDVRNPFGVSDSPPASAPDQSWALGQRVKVMFGPSLELGPNVTLSVEMGELGMSGLPHVWSCLSLAKRDSNVALRWCEGWSRFCSPKNVDQTWELGV
ncbi:hypothetical protein PIB30_065892 [Stylosanthes scabra]|uniref:Uncharacterized protein n=1 Tax=Stylosanthes scabra TaxID=79078 RepID=A0ABU6XLV9_9FABA|nr:hypothetical protein [Stylosanthes scabra]